MKFENHDLHHALGLPEWVSQSEAEEIALLTKQRQQRQQPAPEVALLQAEGEKP